MALKKGHWQSAGFAVLVAIAAATLIATSWAGIKRDRKQAAAELVYIKAYDCLVVQSGHDVDTQYRCELPQRRYLDGFELRRLVSESGSKP